MSQGVILGELIRPAQLLRAGSREYPILSMTMRGGLVDQDKKFKKRIASRDTSTYKVAMRGQLVIGFPIDEGVLSIQNKYAEAIVSPAYDIWDIVDAEKIDPRYLELYLKSPRALNYYRAKLRGSTARRRSLPRDVLLELPVTLPILARQLEAVLFLDGAAALREKRRNSIALLNDLAQSIFLDMFGDPSRGTTPWPMKKIGDLIESTQYGTSEKAKPEGDLPVLRMGNISSTGEIDLRDLKFMDRATIDGRYIANCGDVLFNRTNSPELVGKTAIYRGDTPIAYAGYLIRLRANSRNNGEYIAAFLNTQYAKRVLRNLCKTIVGMANINARELRGIDIAEVPLALQQEFAARIARLEKIKASHTAHLTELDALFASLQHRAFRDELRDTVAA